MEEPNGWDVGRPGDRLDEDVRAAFCRKFALQTLKRFGIADAPVPVERLASRLGFQVETKALPRGVDAKLRVVDGGRVIELASGQPRTRQRFSIAHELGHHLLKHRHGESDVAEKQANIFAGALLAPGAWLARDLATGHTSASLAEKYQVSKEVIFIAAKDARLLGRLA
ncbi:MAG: ImmA/IrrE family metallo-endopeptidase [Actinomycetota bacterium]